MKLQIKGKEFEFKASMSFLRQIQPTYKNPQTNQEMGLTFKVAEVIDGNILALNELLYMLNSGQSPRIKKEELESYLEEDVEDIESLTNEVLSFLESANVTKVAMKKLMKAVKEQEDKSQNQ